MMGEYFATQDPDLFNVGPFKSREEAIKRAPMQEGWSDGEFWIGELVQVDPPVLDAGEILDGFHEQYKERCGDPVGNWPLEDVEQKHIEELTKNLNRVFSDWLGEHNAVPTFGAMENITTHQIEEGTIEGEAKENAEAAPKAPEAAEQAKEK